MALQLGPVSEALLLCGAPEDNTDAAADESDAHKSRFASVDTGSFADLDG